MAERPSTPPRATHSGSLPANPLTPEQVRRVEEARLKAKAHRLQQGLSNPSSTQTISTTTAGQKRPHSLISSNKNIPETLRNAASPGKIPSDAPLKAAKKFQKNAYIEYDFSKMTDTKGGFLNNQDDPFNKQLHGKSQDDPAKGKPANMTMKEWERLQLLKKLRANKAGPFEPGISAVDVDPTDTSKKCRECGGLEIDFSWVDIFGTSVCYSCKEKYPEKYSLLTKTEAREDYLLTGPELDDTDLLPRLEKPNPHKAQWATMYLFLRYQVEEYAFSPQKWGSQEKLDEEFEARQVVKRERKDQKFKTKLKELKKKTRVEAYKRSRGIGDGLGGAEKFGDVVKRRGDGHVHEWGVPVEDATTGVSTKSCVECGIECEEIEF
ncbi:DNA repair protein [Venturia nashicola]|uniref:DNA repair protein RAD14 n=1 Tax=Venturia nashicola TaxID=86259 RepID=A0A4Z1P5C8_9PEZI|nr:DNA repair protein [Venturia nashicola]TLD30077.1 DNA repair protein [Venturia nashicola]